MKFTVRLNEKFVVFKQYTNGNIIYSKPIGYYNTLKEVAKLHEDAIPANNVGGGHIAGMDLGYSATKKKKLKKQILTRFGVINGRNNII